MEVFKAFSEEVNGPEGKKLGENISKLTGKPDLVILYFTIEHSGEEDVRAYLEKIRESLPEGTVLAGVSVAAFKTNENRLIRTQGGVAIILKGIQVKANRLEKSIWNASVDEVKKVYMENSGSGSFNFIFCCGPRQSRKESVVWKYAQKQAIKALKIPLLREKIINMTLKRAWKDKIGYPPGYFGLNSLASGGRKFLWNDSVDGGSWTKGYEILNTKIFNSETLINVSLSPASNIKVLETLPLTDENMKKLDVVREYKKVDYYKSVIYGLDGKSISSVREELPVATRRLERGGFGYYGIFVSKKRRIPLTFGNIDVIPLEFLVEEPGKVLIVRAEGLGDYKEKLEKKVESLDRNKLVQVNIHSSVINFFGEKMEKVMDSLNGKLNNWVVIIGDNFYCSKGSQNFFYPVIVTYG